MRRMLVCVSVLMVLVLASMTGARATTSFTVFRVGGGATEPEVTVGDSGSVFVDGPAGLGTHSRLWRAADGAQAQGSFQQITFTNPWGRLPGGGDSSVITRGNRVYFLDLWAGSDSLAISEDDGQTWSLGTPITTLPASDRQWLALGPVDPLTGFDTVYAEYHFIQPPSTAMLAKSTDGGLTWTTHVALPFSGSTGRLVSDGANFLSINYRKSGGMYNATSSDGGQTWTEHFIDNFAGGSSIVGNAIDGNDLYAAWIDSGSNVRVAVSHDKGQTWQNNTVVSADATTNIFPWIDARGGKAAVAWYGADVDTGDPNTVPGDTVWHVRYASSSDAGSTWSTAQDVADAKTGIICTQGLSCNSGRELGDFMTVAINGAGKSLLVFGGEVAGGIRIAREL
ncbi:MAG: glycoside hydrolase [Actinobacteria bacterium]|nr:glycoside hydrolase [Actinomycetota bacterium]